VTGNGAPREPVLAATGLVGGYTAEVDILRGCSLEARSGEVVVVIGPNGAGKSTLVKAIFGLVRLREGTVTVKGEDVTGAKPHDITRRGMSYVPQVSNIFATMTVQENLEMGGVTSRGGARRRMDDIYALFPRLAQRRRQRAGTMSGGERQMLAMGRALMTGPTVLLLDEPSAGLAPQVVGEVFETCQRINRAGITIVMIEQSARRALALADRGYVLEGGANRYTGTGRELLDDPKIAQLYLGGSRSGTAPRGAIPAE
jgi:branched-chain amino acid transport system ATP-binding protein